MLAGIPRLRCAAAAAAFMLAAAAGSGSAAAWSLEEAAAPYKGTTISRPWTS
jgi:multiple sugar transport system substrate-binding protein